MSVSVIQNNFIGGEVSPSLFGRLDDQLVGAGAATLKNFLVQPSGSLKKRSGFKFMRDLGTGRFRLIPFRFASDQTLVLVFGNNVMYVAVVHCVLVLHTQRARYGSLSIPKMRT